MRRKWTHVRQKVHEHVYGLRSVCVCMHMCTDLYKNIFGGPLLNNVLKGSHQKKTYQILDIVQNSADPLPPLGRYGRKKFGRSDLARTPPLPLP